MNIGIIGSEAAKFNEDTKTAAQQLIVDLIEEIHYKQGLTYCVVSGHCHLGGIDIWAEELALEYDATTLIFPPTRQCWEPHGYKERNIKIAENSDVIHVITVKELPDTYKGMRFNDCYHCARRLPIKDGFTTKHKSGRVYVNGRGFDVPHIKSGACWTAWYAVEKLNKPAFWHIL